MRACDPARNHPLPSTGDGFTEKPEPTNQRPPPPAPQPPSGIRPTGGPRTEQLPGQPKFNSLHISRLLIKVDGHSETLFIAILNGNAVGYVIGMTKPWKACGLRMLFVTPKHRHMGIGIRLVKDVEAWAKELGENSIEIAVHKGNVEGRTFWIRRRFIDDETRDMSVTPEYQCMIKTL